VHRRTSEDRPDAALSVCPMSACRAAVGGDSSGPIPITCRGHSLGSAGCSTAYSNPLLPVVIVVEKPGRMTLLSMQIAPEQTCGGCRALT